MELKEGTSVYTVDGEEIGKINRFVLNPISKEVTHFVVQKGLLFPEDKVVPMDWVTDTQSDRVTISRSATVVADLPPFEETHYVELDETEQRRMAAVPYTYAPTYYWYPPYSVAPLSNPYYPADMAAETERNIPENTVALSEGADVISTDDVHIGDVERIFVDPETNRATHFLISQGVLLKERKLIPLDWIQRIMENHVYLAVGSSLVDRLPGYQD